MAQWEPLDAALPAEKRRLATQLRRMRDRSGLGTAELARRTALETDAWERAFAGQEVPPLGAVQVLAQASGADYARIGALHRLAGRAGEQGAGEPLPDPDPLDPLGPDDGLPRRRRALLPALLGALATAALVAVILTAGPSTGRAPAGDVGTPSFTAPGGPAPTAPARPRGTPQPGGPARPPQATTSHADTPPPTRSSPPVPTLRTPPADAPTETPSAPAATPTPSPPSPVPTPAPTPSRSPAPRPVCLGLVVLGVCLG